jgi:hypothetical protein
MRGADLPSVLKPRLEPERFRAVHFSVRGFIDGLTRTLVEDAAASDARGDVSGRFGDESERAEAWLSAAAAGLEETREANQRALRVAERAAAQRSAAVLAEQAALEAAVEAAAAALESLDGRMVRVGSLAVRVGERLHAYDVQARAAERLRVMLESLRDFMAGFPPSTEAFLDVTRVREKAEVLAYLRAAVGELRMDRTATAADVIARECDRLEQQVLRRLEEALDAHAVAELRAVTALLFRFNGGDSAVQSFLARVPMFSDPQSLRSDEFLAALPASSSAVRPGALGAAGSDDAAAGASTAAGAEDSKDVGAVRCDRIAQFFRAVAGGFAEEAALIDQVFPNADVVRRQLIHRIFGDRVALFLSRALRLPRRSAAGSSPLLLHLRSLAAAYDACGELVRSFAPRPAEELTAQALMEPLFRGLRDSYPALETECLARFYDEEIHDLIEEYGGTVGVEVAEAVLGDVESMLVLLHANEDALRRASLLCDEQMLPHTTSRIYLELLGALGGQLLQPLLQGCLVELTKTLRYQTSGVVGAVARELSSTASDGSRVLRVVHACTGLVARVERHFHSLVLRNLPHTLRLNRVLVARTRSWVRGIEQRISAALDAVLNIERAKLAASLATHQKKSDYRLADTALSEIDQVTDACGRVILLVQDFALLCADTLDEANCARYLDEFGAVLAAVLYAHYKKQPIGPGMGALRLQRDLKQYLELAEAIVSNQSVLLRFQLLVELASIHMLAPQQLRSFFEERGLYRLKRSELLDFLKQRPDFKPAWETQYGLFPSHRAKE